MTTVTYTSVIDHTSDAGFRAWGSELSTNLATAGLVVTADTGQINWTTVTRPGTNTSGGYEIWRFADSTLYLKIEYGTGGGATTPQMWITVGTGSNGSGTLTGQLSTRNICTAQVAPASTVTTYTTYLSRTADSFACLFKLNALSSAHPLGLMVIGKTVDGAGAATTTGFGILRVVSSSAALSFQSVRIVATAVTYTDSNNSTCIPGTPSSSTASSGAFQAYEIWMNVPDVQPFNWANVVLISEAAKGATFTVAMTGTTARTYLSIGQINASAGVAAYTVGTYSYAMIWE